MILQVQFRNLLPAEVTTQQLPGQAQCSVPEERTEGIRVLLKKSRKAIKVETALTKPQCNSGQRSSVAWEPQNGVAQFKFKPKSVCPNGQCLDAKET